jgi:hypothetical protein
MGGLKVYQYALMGSASAHSNFLKLENTLKCMSGAGVLDNLRWVNVGVH